MKYAAYLLTLSSFFSSFAYAENYSNMFLTLRLESNNTLVLSQLKEKCVYGRYAFVMDPFGSKIANACWESYNSNKNVLVVYDDGDVMNYESIDLKVVVTDKKNTSTY